MKRVSIIQRIIRTLSTKIRPKFDRNSSRRSDPLSRERREGRILSILNINFWAVIALVHSAAAVKTDNRKRGARGAIGKARWKEGERARHGEGRVEG